MSYRTKHEFGGFLYRSFDEMLTAIARTWLSSDGANSIEFQKQEIARATDQELAAECIEGYGLDEGGDAWDPFDDEEEPSHAAFNGYDAEDLAGAFADLREELA